MKISSEVTTNVNKISYKNHIIIIIIIEKINRTVFEICQNLFDILVF